MKLTYVSFQPFTHSLWSLVVERFNNNESHESLTEGSPAHKSDAPVWPRATLRLDSQERNCRCRFPFTPSWDCSVGCSSFHPWRSHDRLPLLLHHRGGFLFLARPRASGLLLLGNVELLCWRRHGVLWDGAVLYVAREVPVAVYRHGSQPGGEVKSQRSSGCDVGNTGVWYHRSIAVRVTAAPSFPFEVQGQSPPAPGLLDLSLHLRKQESTYSSCVRTYMREFLL